MRALALVTLVACASPPPKPVAQPVATAVVDDRPSWVGVRVDDVPVRITQVIRGAPGDKAGLKIGDQLVSVNGDPITSGPAFVERTKGTRNGDTLRIVVIRGGGKITFDVEVEPRPESIATSALLGKPAPAFDAVKLAGEGSTKLADLRGNVVLVDFWATWCGPCAMTIPRLGELHAQLGPRGLRVVGLSSEEPELIRDFVADRAIDYDIGHDANEVIAGAYLREGIPMFVVIDRSGIVRDVIVGSNMEAVEAAVLRLL